MILALYLRLSQEDGDMEDESNSITHQRLLLHRYVEQHVELRCFQLREYVDDGYSGKNFNRPGVTKLLRDLRAEQVQGVIVKDFSRFGRNHIEVGEYIEKIFPLLGIRFISVNNHFDSEDCERGIPGMDVAFENLMYDYFSEENSIKVKNAKFKKRMAGNYIGTYAPFGYKKMPENHNRLIVDEEAAQIIKLTFELYAECGVMAEVARRLNREGIPTPQEYLVRKGLMKYQRGQSEVKLWYSQLVRSIVRNPVYIGNLVFHKEAAKEVGSGKTKRLPQSEWKVRENTHEAIISKELFERVNSPEFRTMWKNKGTSNKIRKQKRKKWSSSINGLVKCGGCKRTMTRGQSSDAIYYCRLHRELGCPGCCPGNVKEKELIELLENEISRQAILASNLKKLLDFRMEKIKEQQRQHEKEISLLRDEIEKRRNENFFLYEQYKSGQISHSDFQTQRQRNLKKLETCQTRMEKLDNQETQIPAEDDSGLFALLEGKQDMKKLTKETVRQLVSAIYVYEDNRVEIVFRFKDEMEKLMEFV